MIPSSSWRLLQTRNNAAADIKATCQQKANLHNARAWKVVNDNNIPVGGKGVGAAATRTFYVYIPPQICTLLLPKQPSSIASPKETKSSAAARQQKFPLRIILAIHGYGGRPHQEIRKWSTAADALHSAILAPMGTITVTDKGDKLGFNAIHCCGDPIESGVDDVDFVVNGVVEVFLDVLRGQFEDGANEEDVHVIATGFSNGGFLSSLLGLLSHDTRPSWLVGIVPTGGYQYDIELYGGQSSKPQPLPMMSHHGGRDSTVLPDGCCTESNCEFDIGIKQKVCTSAQTAFELWSRINKCSSTVLYGGMSHNDRRHGLTCWKGVECSATTNFCLWNSEGHSWGYQFPGVDLVQSWMKGVFRRAEMRGGNIDDHDESMNASSYASAISYNHSKGRRDFILLSFALLCILLIVLKKVSVGKRIHSYKRKTSEEGLSSSGNSKDGTDLEKLVVLDAH